jgi:hypothetical protein
MHALTRRAAVTGALRFQYVPHEGYDAGVFAGCAEETPLRARRPASMAKTTAIRA